MCALPLDICREIFVRSSAQSLIRFRAVCQQWRAAIDDPRFVQTHTNEQVSSTTILIRSSTGPPFYPLYSFDLETLDFANGLQSLSAAPLSMTREGLSRLPKFPAAACNGLMLIPPPYGEESNWEIWNILTHERLQLPRLHSSVDSWESNGLGYDCETDDYKAVVIVRQKSKSHTHVYSLRSDKWREISNLPCVDWGTKCPVGVYLGGALHWITMDGITVLDLKTEIYCKMEQPPLHKEYYFIRNIGIYVLGGCLILTDYGEDDYGGYFDLWVMKDYTSWVKVFNTWDGAFPGASRCLKPLAFMKNKMRFFLQDSVGFYMLDVKSDSAKMVCIHGLSGDLSAQVFQGSIFRLHDNCGRLISRSGTKGRRIKTANVDTELVCCVRDDEAVTEAAWTSHFSCFSLDSNLYHSSTEDEDESHD